MAGISSKAAGSLLNRKGYNGNELQNKEFSDGSGLEMYDFNARTYDQQIGRFIQIDPLIEQGDQEAISPYHFGKNNPVRYNDPDGKCPTCIIGALVGAAVDYGTQVAGNLIQGKSLGDALIQVDGMSILISAGAGALTGGVSAFVPKGAAGKVLVEVAATAIDAGESALKQYNETGTVAVNQTLADVVNNKVAGKLTASVDVNSSNTIKTTQKQLDRAQRVAAGDPASSGRSATSNKVENKLAIQRGANHAASQAASGTLSSTIQGATSTAQGTMKVSPSVNVTPIDNTTIKKTIVLPLAQQIL